MAKIKSLHELLMGFYGIETVPKINRTASSVGVTATKICTNNPKRAYLTIVNLSVNDIYLLIDNSVSSSKGIYLSPNGGSFVLRWVEDFDLLEHEWYAVAGGAASAILVIEGEIL